MAQNEPQRKETPPGPSPNSPSLLFEYQCTSSKFIRLANRIETFCPNWNALVAMERCDRHGRVCPYDVQRHRATSTDAHCVWCVGQISSSGAVADRLLGARRDVGDRSIASFDVAGLEGAGEVGPWSGG